MTERTCGTCTLCCKLTPVAALGKPAGVWCAHIVQGKGCGIHGDHPEACRIFRCGWLDLPDLDEAWKPQRCGFVIRITGGGERMIVDVDPAKPDAWRRAPFYAQIKAWSAQLRTSARHVVVYCGAQVTAVFPEAELEVGRQAPGDFLTMGYEASGLMVRPFARLTRADGAESYVTGQAQLA